MSRKRHSPAELKALWGRLHKADREPWPDAAQIGRCAESAAGFEGWVGEHGGARKVAEGLQAAWIEFHAGGFARAIELGAELGALGACVANRAAAVESTYARGSANAVLDMLRTAIARGERAVATLADHPNAHYMLALVLGRYSQRISIMKALSEGLATRVKSHLDRTLALEPRHAEAHIALGLYHAEIINKLGGLLARTYGASAAQAVEHFRRAVKLAPESPIVRIEYANGLLLLDGEPQREEAERLYREAAAIEPMDAMEALDVERAKRGLSG